MPTSNHSRYIVKSLVHASRVLEAFQTSGEQHIVAVEPTHIGRRTLGDTLIDRGCLTSIRVAAPARKPALKFLDDVDRLICRPSIGNKDFDWQVLLKD